MKQWILAPSLRSSAVAWSSQSLWHPPPAQPGSRGWQPWPGRWDTILVQLDLSQVPLGQGTHSLWPVPLLGKVEIRHPRHPAALRVSGVVGWQPIARVGPLMETEGHILISNAPDVNPGRRRHSLVRCPSACSVGG